MGVSTASKAGRPSLESQIAALARRLLAGPIKIEETTDVEDRVLARMEQLDLVDLGAMTARLTEKGKALAMSVGAGVVPSAATPTRRTVHAVAADPSAMTWEEPPPRARGGRNSIHWFAPFVDKLKAKPGAWARVLTAGDTKLSSSRARSAFAWAKLHKIPIEMVARSGSVYARYVGKK